MKYEITPDVEKRLARDFVYHAPKDDQAERYTFIRDAAGTFARSLCKICPSSRELSVALTHLDQVVFNANAAIARNE